MTRVVLSSLVSTMRDNSKILSNLIKDIVLCPEIRCNIVSGSMWVPYYTMQNNFSNCFVWLSPSTSGLKVFF